MAAKSTTTKKIASEVKAPERARVTKPGTPRVKAARHTTASVEQIPAEKEDVQTVIARLAYGFWEARGGDGGDPLEDWLRAEQQYRQTL
jgi:hypothetical protein